jgi:CubicO group peptidase (beta-lactamase class C family)
MRKYFIGILPVLLISVFLLTGCSGKTGTLGLSEEYVTGLSRQELQDVLRGYIDSRREEAGIAGVTVSVVAGDVILNDGLGVLDREQNIPADSHSLFPVGSISKIFTALGIARLAEQGLVDLDDPVSVYLPELSLEGGAEMRMTLRLLLTHHSGLPGDLLSNFVGPDSSPEEMADLPLNLQGTPAAYEPGELFSYSNLGYSLLGLVIQRVTGKDFAAYMEEEVFPAAGMSEGVAFLRDEDAGRTAQPYVKKKRQEQPRLRDIPAGGLALSSSDVSALFQTIFAVHRGEARPLLGTEAYREMMTRQNEGVALDGDFSIGLGWWLINPLGLPVQMAGHGGDLPPYHSMLIVIPDEEIGVFISINTGGGAASFPLETAMELTRAVYAWKTGNLLPDQPVPPVREMSSEEKAAMEGFYSSPLGLMELVSEREELKLVTSKGTLYLIPREGGEYSCELRLLGKVPLPIKDLEPLRFRFFAEGEDRYAAFYMAGVFGGIGMRIDPAAVTLPEEAGRFICEYRLIGEEALSRHVKDLRLERDKKNGAPGLAVLLFRESPLLRPGGRRKRPPEDPGEGPGVRRDPGIQDRFGG